MISLVLIDRITFVTLCALVFVLPVTNAGVEALSVLAILLFLFKRFSLGRSACCKGLPSVSILLPLILLAGWSMLSIGWSLDRFLSLKGFIGKSLQGMFLFLIAYETVPSLKKARILVAVLLFSAGIIGLDSLWQWYSGFDFFIREPFNVGRVTASFKHPNDFGTYLLVIILPALTLVFIDGARFLKEHSLKNGVWVLGRALFMGIMAAALGMTYSRGAWIAVLVAFLVFMCFVRQIRLFLLLCVVVFGFIFLPLLAQGRQVSFFSDVLDTPYTIGGSGRLVYWNDAIRIIQDHPVFGTGLNTYTLVIKDYAEVWKAYPHNCYLQMGAELGLVGLAFFLWFLGVVIVHVSRRIWCMPQQPERWMFAAFFAGWCGVLVHSGFDTTLYSSKLSALFWVLTGLLLGTCKFEGVFNGKK